MEYFYETVKDFANEVGSGLDAHSLPAYAPMMAAYHRSHASELRAMIETLPIKPGDRVLDMACGDGTHALWIAERLSSDGEMVGADISPAYLAIARQRAKLSPYSSIMHFHIGSIESLPFDQDMFDLVWCAHSLYSLPDPILSLRELRRVVHPGGIVALLEQDTLHHVIMPWPVEVELSVRQAQLRSLQKEASDTRKYFAGRRLDSLMRAANLTTYSITPFATLRRAPLSEDEYTYLTWYLSDLSRRARPYLAPSMRKRFDSLVDPRSAMFLLKQPDFYVTYIDMLACGVIGPVVRGE